MNLALEAIASCVPKAGQHPCVIPLIDRFNTVRARHFQDRVRLTEHYLSHTFDNDDKVIVNKPAAENKEPKRTSAPKSKPEKEDDFIDLRPEKPAAPVNIRNDDYKPHKFELEDKERQYVPIDLVDEDYSALLEKLEEDEPFDKKTLKDGLIGAIALGDAKHINLFGDLNAPTQIDLELFNRRVEELKKDPLVDVLVNRYCTKAGSDTLGSVVQNNTSRYGNDDVLMDYLHGEYCELVENPPEKTESLEIKEESVYIPMTQVDQPTRTFIQKVKNKSGDFTKEEVKNAIINMIATEDAKYTDIYDDVGSAGADDENVAAAQKIDKTLYEQRVRELQNDKGVDLLSDQLSQSRQLRERVLVTAFKDQKSVEGNNTSVPGIMRRLYQTYKAKYEADQPYGNYLKELEDDNLKNDADAEREVKEMERQWHM